MSLPFLLLTIAVIILLSVGTLGILDPKLPDLPLLWLGLLLFSAFTRFSIIDLPLFLVLTAGVVITVVLEANRFSSLQPTGGHSSSNALALICATVSGIIGALIGSPYGLALGVLWGALLGKLAFSHDRLFTYETNIYRVVGFVGITLLKISVAVAIVGVFFQRLTMEVL